MWQSEPALCGTHELVEAITIMSKPMQQTASSSGNHGRRQTKYKLLSLLFFVTVSIFIGVYVEEFPFLKPVSVVAKIDIKNKQGQISPRSIKRENSHVVIDGKATLQGNLSPSKRRQKSAKAALQKMYDRKAFETKISTAQSVMEMGYPFQWEPCTLHRSFQKKQTPKLQFVIMGGSASSRPALNCREDPIEARFSNVLQANLQQDAAGSLSDMELEVINMSQGSANSAHFGLVLDQLIDPRQADVLIWEGCINDLRTTKQLLFELWLARVDSLYSSVGKDRPPILFLCLWPARKVDRPTSQKILHQGLGTPMIAASNYVDYYRNQQNWNIHAVSVGSVINNTAVAHDTHLLFDDNHHPNCLGVQLIADMIEHAIYSDMASCDADTIEISGYPNKQITVENLFVNPIMNNSQSKTMLENIKERWIRDLWDMFLRKDVRAGSVSPWEPKAKNMTGFRLENREQVMHYPANFNHIIEPGRTDRKMDYILPLCSVGSSLEYVLSEPNLEWLGFGMRTPQAADVTINGRSVTLYRNNKILNNNLHVHNMQSWIHISSRGIPLSKVYTVSVCQKDKESDPYFSQLVGLMLPEITAS